MLPWVIDLLKRLPRRLHSDGEEFVFLTPVPPRGFWAKAQRQKPRRPRLPDLLPGEAVEIVIRLPN